MHRLLRVPGSPCLGIIAKPHRPSLPNPICSSNRQMFGWAWPFSKRRDSTAATANPSQLQNLLNVAHGVARSEDISRESTDMIAAAMGNVPLHELGFDQQSSRGPLLSGSGAQTGRGLPIEYQHIFEDKLVSIGVFKLPAGSTIPLHNHPGMHVWSRILYGSINLRAFDWASDSRSSSRSGKPAAAVLSRDQTVDSKQSPSLLTPSDSNLHQFTAAADTAILDVLIPPYNPRGGTFPQIDLAACVEHLKAVRAASIHTKRLRFGEITQAAIVHIMRRFPPQLILLGRNVISDAFPSQLIFVASEEPIGA